MTEEEKPTLAERYTGAINATDLTMTDRRAGSADLLAAVGISSGLGSLLLRLRTEYDSVKGEHGLADAEIERLRGRIRDHLSAAQREDRQADKGPTRAAFHRREAEWLRVQAEGTQATETALFLMHLKTLREAKNALAAYAMVMATKRRHMIPDREVIALTGHVLAAWLDVRCRKCHGTTLLGDYGQRQVRCRACGGTGNASANLGQTHAQQLFCADLLRDIAQKSGYEASRDVNKNKAAIKAGKERIAADLAQTR